MSSAPASPAAARPRLRGGVHVRWIALADAPPSATLVGGLSERERRRLAGTADPATAERFVLGRAALRSLARELSGGRAVTVRARCATCGGDHGRPVLGGTTRLERSHASIAHCAGAVVVAVSTEGPVGVDVEDAVADAERLRAVDALVRPGPGVEDEPDPLRRWTRIEAVLKADGRGLTVDPASVHLRREGRLVSAAIGDGTARYRVADVALDPSLVVSLATAEESRPGVAPTATCRRRLRPDELAG